MTKRQHRDMSIHAAIVTGVFVVIAAVVGALPQCFGSRFVKDQSLTVPVHQLRVIVLDPGGFPVDDAKVWSSVGGEAKVIPGGWQFDIPSSARPAYAQATIFASKPSSFLRGSTAFTLGPDPHKVVTVRLKKIDPSTIRGIVIDEHGNGLGAAKISVVGLESESISTDAAGRFLLTTDAADGQQVLLHAERQAYRPVTQWHPAGQQLVTITMERRK